MYQFDFHHHTEHSFDSKETIKNACEKAIELHFDALCFTEHFSLNPNVPTYGYMDWKAYETDIEQAQIRYEEQLVISKGIEICEPHLFFNHYQKLFDSKYVDYILGSVHNVNDIKLRHLLTEYGKAQAYNMYFDQVLSMVQQADIDIIAHLDLIKRYSQETFRDEDYQRHIDQIKTILQTAIYRNIGLEVNTSTFEKLGESMPSTSILILYYDLGGRIITYGSDAHDITRTGSRFKETMKMLYDIGFEHVYTFKNRKPLPHLLKQF